MADQHPYGYEERFKFTGKERDTETGYDYFGARYYVSSLQIWLSVDPLSDKYPNISPYAYAGNNFINAIDWMGLGGMSSFSHSYGTCEWIAIDGDGTIVDLNLEHWDKGVYEVDDEWDHTYWDLLRYEIIGNHTGLGAGWRKGTNIKGKFHQSGGGYYNRTLGRWINYGTIPRQDASIMSSIFRTDPSLAKIALLSYAGDIIKDVYLSTLYNKNIEIGKAKKILNHTTTLLMKGAQRVVTYISVGAIGYDMFANGINVQNTTDAVELALTEYLIYVVSTQGLTGLAKTLGEGAYVALGIGYLVGIGYIGSVGLTKINNELNNRFAGWEWMREFYGY